MKLQEMGSQTKLAHRMLWGALILVAAFAVSEGIWSLLHKKTAARFAITIEDESSRRPEYNLVPDFSFTDHNGRRVSLSDLRSKIWIADFIFTSCSDECVLMSGQMAKLQAEFSREKEVLFVSFSIDPERDTLETLSLYAKRFGADPRRWLFLTGQKEALYRLAQNGFHLSVVDINDKTQLKNEESGKVGRQESGKKKFLTFLLSHFPTFSFSSPVLAHDTTNDQKIDRKIIHSSRFVLVDRQARIRGYYDSDDEESLRQLRQVVRNLLKP